MSLFEMKQCLMTKKEDNNLTKMPEGEMNLLERPVKTFIWF